VRSNVTLRQIDGFLLAGELLVFIVGSLFALFLSLLFFW